MTQVNVLVTGATGFIGRALCRYLAEMGYRVTAVSRSGVEEIPGLKSEVVGDLTGDTDWSPFLGNIDVVIHLAARAHRLAEDAEASKNLYRVVNTDVTIRLASDARRMGVKRIIFLSSIGVNGAETFGSPFIVSDTARPHSIYAKSKLEAEQGLWSLLSGGSTELVVVRTPLVYGVDAPGNVGLIIKWIKKGYPLPLLAIKNKRSFISLTNLTQFLEQCIWHPAAADKLFLVSDGSDISTPTFIQAVGRMLGLRPKLFWVPNVILKTALRVLGKNTVRQSLYGDLQIDITDTLTSLDWKPEAPSEP